MIATATFRNSFIAVPEHWEAENIELPTSFRVLGLLSDLSFETQELCRVWKFAAAEKLRVNNEWGVTKGELAHFPSEIRDSLEGSANNNLREIRDYVSSLWGTLAAAIRQDLGLSTNTLVSVFGEKIATR